MDIHKITIELARPRGSFPGKIATGYYAVADGTVTLFEENGVPVDKYKLSRKLPPGGDAKAVACNLLRSRYSGQSSNFNRQLSYPKVGF
jgi:hypothetical protein